MVTAENDCGTEYLPICGTVLQNKVHYERTFFNVCQMLMTNRKNIRLENGNVFVQKGAPNRTCIQHHDEATHSGKKSDIAVDFCTQIVCDNENVPVCGVNDPASGSTKMTFSNMCEMDAYNCRSWLIPHSPIYQICKDLHEEAAKDRPPGVVMANVCDTMVCTDEFVPVCGETVENGQPLEITFANMCVMDFANCQIGLKQNASKIVRKGGWNITCNDLNQNWELATVENCDKYSCTYEFRPLCATTLEDFKTIEITFTNECVFNYANCLRRMIANAAVYTQIGASDRTCNHLNGISTIGEFVVDVAAIAAGICEMRCSDEIWSVCGETVQQNATIEMTFRNICELSLTNCRNRNIAGAPIYLQIGPLNRTCIEVDTRNG